VRDGFPIREVLPRLADRLQSSEGKVLSVDLLVESGFHLVVELVDSVDVRVGSKLTQF